MNYQTLASAIMADWKSKVHDDELKDMIFKSVLDEHIKTIVDGVGEV